jgi:hypothetical protein
MMSPRGKSAASPRARRFPHAQPFPTALSLTVPGSPRNRVRPQDVLYPYSPPPRRPGLPNAEEEGQATSPPGLVLYLRSGLAESWVSLLLYLQLIYNNSLKFGRQIKRLDLLL